MIALIIGPVSFLNVESIEFQIWIAFTVSVVFNCF